MQNETYDWREDAVGNIMAMTVEAAEVYIAQCARSDVKRARDVDTACWKQLVSNAGLGSLRETTTLASPQISQLSKAEFHSGTDEPAMEATVEHARGTECHIETPQTESTSLLCDGRYQVLETLGRGGFGVVYKAFDSRTEQVVALKTMMRCDPQELSFFKSEFRHLQGIAHENLVQLLGLHTDGVDWILAMEYVPGSDFDSFVRPKQALDEGRLRAAFVQLVQGVAALHRHRRLHRDLKGKNVRVTPAGRVVILDFGLAAELDEKGRSKWSSSSILGTIPFMPPEMFTADPQSSSAGDIYALGVMLYQSLTGRLPYEGSLRDIVRGKLQYAPPAPSSLVPECPADLSELCLGLLAHDSDQRPTADVLLNRLHSRHKAKAVSLQVEKLLGREAELAALSEAFSANDTTGASVLFISGQSGVGKSALLDSFLEQVPEDAVVLQGRCYEHESIPYKALDPVIDNLVRYLEGVSPSVAETLVPDDVSALVRVFPVLGRVKAFAARAASLPIHYDSQELRRRAFAGLRFLLGKLAANGRVVIHIDDVQWGDADSALLITELIRPPAAPGVIWYISHRSEDSENACLSKLSELFKRFDIPKRSVNLHPFEIHETALLVEQIIGEHRPETAAAIHRESGGNPYFAAELARFVHADQRPQADLNLTLDSLIQARLKGLTLDARHLLEVIAVAGRPIGEFQAFRAAEQTKDARTAAAQLEAGRFLRGIGSAAELELETYHDRVREAVIAGLQPDVLRQHHYNLGVTLESSEQAVADHLAVHFEAAGENEKAGHYYYKAGDEAAEALAFDQAVSFYRKALDLSQLSTDQRRTLHRKWADALADAGRGSEAATAYLSLAEDPDSTDERFELQRLAADQSFLCGDRERGINLLEQLNHSVGLPFPKTNEETLIILGEAQAELNRRGLDYELRNPSEIPTDVLRKVDICAIAGTRFSLINAASYAFFSTLYIQLALDSGERGRIASALASAGFATTCAGGENVAIGEKIVSQGMQLAEEDGNPLVIAITHLWNGFAAWSGGRWRAALERFESAAAVASRGQVLHATGEVKLRHGILDCLMFLGDWSEMRRRIPEWLADSYRRGNRMSSSMYLVHSYVNALAEDRPGKAEGLLRQAWEIWPQSQDMILTFWGHFASVEIMLYHGRTHDAWENLKQNSERVGQYTMFESMQTLALLFYHLRGRTALAKARAGLDAGLNDWPDALEAAEKEMQRIRGQDAPWARGLARLLEAGLANVRGENARSVNILVDAERDLLEAEQKMLAAAAQWQRGALIGAQAGRSLIQQAENFMTAEGVVSPSRVTHLLVPGFCKVGS